MRVRKATKADALDVLSWRNDPLTRSMSRTPGEVEDAPHLAWFEKALGDPRRTLLIGELDGQKIGMVRFDHGEEIQVSININPACRGRGLSHALLTQSMSWVRGTLVAEIRPENLASQRLFEHAGFSFDGVRDDLRRYVGKATAKPRP
jgi:RimJ/RimL family protein N-acetyltransferase